MKAERARRKTIKPNFRIYRGAEVALGPGKAELLGHIVETGSISQAARRMDMSYNRAWQLVRTMNNCFTNPLVEATRGGDTRGGACLTPTGRRLLALYQQLEEESFAATRATWTRILRHLK